MGKKSPSLSLFLALFLTGIFVTLASAADRVVVIPLNTSNVAVADGKLWGQGRVGTTTTSIGDYNGINIARSTDTVSWDGAAAACPQDTWVCSLSDYSGWVPPLETPYVSIITCAGNPTDTTSNRSWINDTDSTNGTRGKSAETLYEEVALDLWMWVARTSATDYKCTYLPVWCCSTVP